MKYQYFLVLAALGVFAMSCQREESEKDVISQRYIHKYGYAVSAEEWADRNYPGQIISSLRSGSTVTATYEDGMLNGPCSFTYPNSQVVERYVLYKRGSPVKEILYDISGMPMKESVQISDAQSTLTTWYADGVPRSIEEYHEDKLLSGQYFTILNELESHVEKGSGLKSVRDLFGVLISKETIQDGFVVKKESFYSNGTPESITHYLFGKMDGERHTFTDQGVPLAVEQWLAGKLHGTSIYYKNGSKHLQVSYEHGEKTGWEYQFTDGATVSHQISWSHDQKHGPETFFIPGGKKVSWYYEGKEVSKNRYEEIKRLDEMICQVD